VQTSVEEVERATEAPPGHDHVQVWGFEDESAGIVRARVFAPRFGVAEDEACGSASMLLAARLGRPLVIHHGSGSEIFVRPAAAGAVELGGRVKLEHTHEINVRHVQPLP
jgi:predicted PhzF superfamily epimerase YddE/YHI9